MINVGAFTTVGMLYITICSIYVYYVYKYVVCTSIIYKPLNK